MKNKYLKKDTDLQKKDRNLLIIQDQLKQYNNGISKRINLLDNTPNQPTEFRIKNWVELNDDSRGTYNTNSQIIF